MLIYTLMYVTCDEVMNATLIYLQQVGHLICSYLVMNYCSRDSWVWESIILVTCLDSYVCVRDLWYTRMNATPITCKLPTNLICTHHTFVWWMNVPKIAEYENLSLPILLHKRDLWCLCTWHMNTNVPDFYITECHTHGTATCTNPFRCLTQRSLSFV